MLLKIDDIIINTDRITSVQHIPDGTVWVNFQTSGDSAVRETFSPEEGVKLWAFLRSLAQNVMQTDL